MPGGAGGGGGAAAGDGEGEGEWVDIVNSVEFQEGLGEPLMRGEEVKVDPVDFLAVQLEANNLLYSRITYSLQLTV